MLASELARELDITPSVMSRRLQHYYRTTGFRGRTQPLEDRVIEDMRQVHLLMAEHSGISMTKALDIHLGKAVVPVPPAVAQEILQRVAEIEESQKKLDVKFGEILEYFREAHVQGLLPRLKKQSASPRE